MTPPGPRPAGSHSVPDAPQHRRNPIDVAIEILQQRYPEALFAFVGGSFNRGEATRSSDIDLVVIFRSLDHAWRESFHFDGWPVEAFVHDPATLRYFFQEVDARAGIPRLPAMVLEGPTVPAPHPLAEELKTLARNLLASPPAAWDAQRLAVKRYEITDLLGDLSDPRSLLEAAATIAVLHERLADLYFRAQGLWSASNKHIPRQLTNSDPALAARWEAAFLHAWQGQPEKLFPLAEEILRPYGGLLFDGHRLDAPPGWKLSESR